MNDYLSAITDAEKCMDCFKNQKTFFRINEIKISEQKFNEICELRKERTAIPLAYSLDEKIEIGKSWEYYLGYLHPQSLPSVLVSLILNPKHTEHKYVLDMCASPGSKFSHMAALMKNKGIIIVNDIKEEKISALYSTINRLNVLNCIVVRGDASKFWINKRFDRILLDAPCSALGSAYGAISRYKPEISKNLALIQKKMIKNAFSLLKDGGELVYSTCTYAKEENEEVVKFLLENQENAKLVDVGASAASSGCSETQHEKGLSEFGDEFKKCWRIYPQHLMSEGFFISKIRKEAGT